MLCSLFYMLASTSNEPNNYVKGREGTSICFRHGNTWTFFLSIVDWGSGHPTLNFILQTTSDGNFILQTTVITQHLLT